MTNTSRRRTLHYYFGASIVLAVSIIDHYFKCQCMNFLGNTVLLAVWSSTWINSCIFLECPIQITLPKEDGIWIFCASLMQSVVNRRDHGGLITWKRSGFSFYLSPNQCSSESLANQRAVSGILPKYPWKNTWSAWHPKSSTENDANLRWF